MIPEPKPQNASDKLIQEFLENGGEIIQCESGARTEDIDFKGSFYGKRKKKKEE
jgi:N-acetyl-gamma-glutamylphosphate reductase